MIDCFNIRTCHLFPSNVLASQFRLRYRSNIERQSWDVPYWEELEYDTYDNPATTYFTWRDEQDVVRGCARLYPTDRPYMLLEAFSDLVTQWTLPTSDPTVWEGSRLCVDKTLPPETRKRIIHELALGYLEFAIKRNITRIIGVMLPAYWRGVYVNSGWDPEWYGDVTKLPNGDRVRAGGLPVSQAVLDNVRRTTGIYEDVLYFGHNDFGKEKGKTQTHEAA
ncbi:MAG: acyl-homoserine-lactone synthase [Alphaproteobacteria bacterium]|nr:acyl-homoserine-lactone synthase [Alphaproteobacteria bacterium]